MFTNLIFIVVPIIVFVLATIIKLILHWHKHGFDLNYSIAYGHMPSGHTAFVTSLITTIGMIDGWYSATFGLAVGFAIIVILDALRLRVWMGEQAEHINHLIAKLGLDEQGFPRLKERIGHKPSEVIVGAVLGISAAYGLVRLFLPF